MRKAKTLVSFMLLANLVILDLVPAAQVWAQEASVSGEVRSEPDWSEIGESSGAGLLGTPSPFATDTPMPTPQSPSTTPLPQTPTPTLTPSTSSMPSATMKVPMKLRALVRRNFQLFEAIDIEIESDLAVTYSATVKDSSGADAGISVSQVTIGQKRYLRISPTNRVRPGRHTLKVSDWTGKVSTQDFTWGVLAINTPQSVYSPNSTATLLMAVLDEQGNMVCDADLTLDIQTPNGSIDTLSTKEKTIAVTSACSQKNISSSADYGATYQLGGSGKYRMTLTAQTKNGTYIIEDGLTVTENIPYRVERTLPSRLYPVGNQEASFTVIANQDFSGEIVETVPDVFDIASSSATPYDWLASAVATPDGLVTGSDTPQAIRYPFDGNHPITLKFGEQVDDDKEKIEYQKYGLAGHDGVDFDMPEGTPVIAVDDGEVMLAGRGAYGVTVVLEHQWGRSYYGHLQGTGLNVGQKVLKGYKLGLSGSTGLATGPHLHFGMKFSKFDANNGFYGKVDPLPYLTGTSIYPGYGVRLIGWKATLKKGETREFRYIFDAPDVSPQFYSVGPVRFLTQDSKKAKASDNPFVLGLSTEKRTTFADSRLWQIAVDAVEPPQSQNPPAEPPGQAVSAERSVISKGKPVNTNLKENPKALARSRGERPAGVADSDKLFRWEVELPHGTTFGFGDQEPGGIKPAVKIRSRDGWFVQFAPTNASNVTPSVNGNQVEWEIAPGVTARYTALKDRIKADYIVSDASAIAANKLEFTMHYNDEYSGDLPEEAEEGLKNGKGFLTHELLPDGTIAWLGESGGTAFEHPVPVIRDADGKEFTGSYEIQKISQGTSHLTITLPQDKLADAVYPLVIDPVTIDSPGATDWTAYGNKRKLLRDSYGNLIAFMDGDGWNVTYKSYNSLNWTDVIDLDGGAGSSSQISADLDGKPNNEDIHVAFKNSADNDISYCKLAVTRSAANTISSIGSCTLFDIDTYDNVGRPSLIIANKGEGAGKEKVAIAWASNTTSGGTKQGEIRFLQCDVADGCDAASEWKNASEENSGTMPSGAEARGSADFMFAVDVHTTHHAVLTQVPGRPARTPTNAKWDDNGSFSNLTSALDDSSSTSSEIGGLSSTQDYLYIGDATTFSRVVVDMDADAGDINTTGKFGTVQYCSANSDVDTICDTWSSLLDAADNFLNNTDKQTATFTEDGSILFDQPTDWVQSTENTSKAYWMRLRPASDFDAQVQIDEFEVTDRHSHDLLVAAGLDSSDDLRAAYVIWDFVGQAGWENFPNNTTAPAPWREAGAGASSALDDTGGNWGTFTNFPLSATPDLINNAVYVSYVDDETTDVLTVKKALNTQSLIASGSWVSTSFPTVTEATDINFTLTSDQNNIYLFYNLDPDTNNLVYRRCDPRGGGTRDICDNSADWSGEKTLGAVATLLHPQAVISKAFGDTVAIDYIYTNTAGFTSVLYERHYVDADKTIVVAASGDDAWQRDCDDNVTDDQDITATTVKLGRENDDASCSAGTVESENHAGFRFQAIPVAQGAAISSAYLDFRVESRSSGGSVDFTVYGEDTDDSAAFGALTDCTPGVNCTAAINERTRTTTSTAQSIDFRNQSYRIVDVTDLVQEIICRGAANSQPCVGNYNGSGTWASGNDLSLLLISTEGGVADNYAGITAWDATGTVMLDPTLQINLANSGKRYSSGVVKAPAGKTDLDHPFSMDDITWTNNDDSMFASVSASLVPSASSSATPMFMFKANNNNNNNTDSLSATAIVKSSIPTKSYGGDHASGRTIYLQLFHSSNGWETKDSDAVTAPDTEITLSSGTVTGSSNYYASESPGGSCTGSDCWAAWRIYQDAAPEGNQVLSVDNFTTTFTTSGPTNDQLLRHGGWFSSGVEQPFTF